MAILIPVVISTGLSLLTSLFTPKQRTKATEPNLSVPRSDYGSPIPKIYGKVRIEGNKFFPESVAKMYEVETVTEEVGGKGGGGQINESKVVYGTFAVLFSQPQVTLDRIIINGKQIEPTHNFFQEYCTFFDGTQTNPWSEITALEGGDPEGQIAYKGVSYVGFKRVPLQDYGNQIPQQVSAILVDAEFGGQPSVGDVVGDICQKAGISPSIIDTTEIDSLILRDGLLVAQTGEGYRKVLEELMQFFLFTAVETTDGKIAFKTFDRGFEAPLIIPASAFLPVSEEGQENKLFVKSTTPKQDLPNKIIYKYQNENQTHDQDEVIEHFEEFTKENVIEINSSLTSYPYEVRQQTRLILRQFYVQQRNSYKIKLPVSYLDQLNLLRLLSLPNGETVQIHQVTTNSDFSLDIIAKFYTGTISYTYNPGDNPNTSDPPILNDPTQNIPDVYVLDTSIIEENHLPSTLYICATGEALIQVSVDSGTTYPGFVNHEKTSYLGTVDTVLADGSGIDVVNTVDITLETGTVETITQAQFDSGYNLALIGKDNGGIWEGELINFRDVTILAANQYRLSNLKRGAYQTTTFTATHGGTERFFLLKGTGAYYSLLVGDVGFIGGNLAVRAVVADYQNLGTTPVTLFTPQGNAYKPSAPTNLAGEIDKDSNIQYTWDYNNAFSPYTNGQESISYEIDIYDGATFVRTLASTTQNVIYYETVRTGDGVGSTLEIRVYAVSSIVGRGYAGIGTVIPTVNNDVVFGTENGLVFSKTRFVTANYTVQESDNTAIIICTIATPVFLTLTFPNTLSQGFYCYVVNDETSDPASRVSLDVFAFYTPDDKEDLLVGASALVAHVSQGNFFLLANNRKFLQVNSVQQPVRKVWNFEEGDNVAITVVDDEANDKSTIQITAEEADTTTISVAVNYVLQTSDHKKIIEASGTILITLPDGLPNGFEVAIQNVGTGEISLVATSTLNSVGNLITTQWKMAWIQHKGGNIWTAVGALSS